MDGPAVVWHAERVGWALHSTETVSCVPKLHQCSYFQESILQNQWDRLVDTHWGMLAHLKVVQVCLFCHSILLNDPSSKADSLLCKQSKLGQVPLECCSMCACQPVFCRSLEGMKGLMASHMVKALLATTLCLMGRWKRATSFCREAGVQVNAGMAQWRWMGLMEPCKVAIRRSMGRLSR